MLAELLAIAALNQTPAQAKAPPKPVTTVIFGDGEVLEGHPDGPDIDVVIAPGKTKFKSLLKVRGDFKDKLLDSVHEL